ncbi:intersectin-EH binding protein Ibp1 [Mycobacterium sp. NPDC051804]|uniref:intersectin-EH binding protein Ibp1 n=1 Tax=Mycobacterium sp. NPDC051804 TaxID=3364295 RepID=UPI0037989B29
MATQRINASRLILAGGFALAALTAPVTAALTTSEAPGVQACPSGESEDLYTTTCTPELVPNQGGANAGSPYSTIPGNPDLPAIDGIPCAGHNSGQCMGLAEEQQAQTPLVQPHTSVSSSP